MVSGHVGTWKVGSVKVPKEGTKRESSYGCLNGYAVVLPRVRGTSNAELNSTHLVDGLGSRGLEF